MCRNEDESIAHMLKDCPFALNLWEWIGIPQPLTSTFQLDLLEWLKRNFLCNNQFQINGIPWSTLFLFIVWELWKHRNEVAFDNKPLNFNLHHTCIRLATEYFFYVSKQQKGKHFSVSRVYWQKPPMGSYMLNSNGASMGNLGKARGGGLIRDSQRKWVKGYMRKIGMASVEAKFWALRDGLILASQMGINNIVVELDAKVLIDLVCATNSPNRYYTPLLNDCRILLTRF